MDATVVSHAGIANRIKNILSAMSVYDKVCTIHETTNFLFPGISLVDPPKMIYEEDWRLYVQPNEEEYIDDYKTIDLLYERTPEYFIKKYLRVIGQLKINPEIIEYVSEFVDSWDNMVGVHIRSWYCQRRKFHDNSIFEREIDRLPKDQKFFFCSDNSDVYKYFAEKYPDRIILYDRKIFNDPKLAESGHHDDIQITTDAFIELLILSKCAKIIGTYASSFDEVAWWFGGCQAEVIIPEPKNFDEEFNNLIYVKK